MSVTQHRLRTRREELGYTQTELAALIGGTQRQIWTYESGKGLPSVESLIALARALETTTDFLLGFVEQPNITLQDGELSSAELEIINIMRTKTPETRQKLIEIAKVV